VNVVGDGDGYPLGLTAGIPQALLFIAVRSCFARREITVPHDCSAVEMLLLYQKAQRVHSPQMEVQLASLLCLRPLLYRNEPFHGGGELKAYAYWRLDERCELFMNDI